MALNTDTDGLRLGSLGSTVVGVGSIVGLGGIAAITSGAGHPVPHLAFTVL